jgi:hypothetical protein
MKSIVKNFTKDLHILQCNAYNILHIACALPAIKICLVCGCWNGVTRQNLEFLNVQLDLCASIYIAFRKYTGSPEVQ